MPIQKRGSHTVLTQRITPSKKEFKPRYIKKHINVIPYFILTGLKTFNKYVDRDKYLLAEMFMSGSYTESNALSDLYTFTEYSKSTTYDESAVLDLLYEGGNNFSFPSEFYSFPQNNNVLLAKYGQKFDEAKIAKYLLNGVDGMQWYPNTLEVFKRLLPRHNIDIFVKIFAITSTKNHLSANLTISLKAYRLYMEKRSFKNQGFLKVVEGMLYDFRNGTMTFLPGQYRSGRRKINDFANAILGNSNRVVVDSWLSDACGIAEKYIHKNKVSFDSPRTSEYDIIELYIRNLASACGYEPRQIVAMLWTGVRKYQSKFKVYDTETVLKKILQRKRGIH